MLETKDSVIKVLDELILKTIVREPLATVRKNVTIDWTLSENVHARSCACSSITSCRSMDSRPTSGKGDTDGPGRPVLRIVGDCRLIWRGHFFLTSVQPIPSNEGDPVGLEAFLAVDNLDPYPLAGAEGGDAAAAQGGDMDEHVLAAAIG